ncbi:serine/threonine protein kinase [Candidatus Uabimicrobium amorphum]|uniref:Protein kinase n=1 Tax=Uabimicrobium amorphum TaxID=2596890 RepID=A0A5S9IQR8_UABAM|nr:serine/threonine-protein kinase [Candidatus Uabimicrobium amorphum]BBM85732.1 protein kinase [Candidatus Uabimicrobium amorphum]
MVSHKDFFFRKAVLKTNYLTKEQLQQLQEKQDSELSLEEVALEEGLITPEQLEVIHKHIQKEMNLGVTRELPGVVKRSRAPKKQYAHYEILEEISQTPIGRVYKARNTKNDNRVAIKEISPEEECAAIDLERFFQDIERTKSLEHPHIERIYEIHKDNDPPFFVTELISGQSLKKVKSHGMSVLRAVEVVQKIAQALHFAHEKNVYHRNLTPENIFIDSAGDPIVTEFGIIQREYDVGGIKILGTPHYMSPEQARGIQRQIDQQSDIFSLGIIFYEMLSKKLPFEGKNLEDIVANIQVQTPTPLCKVDSQIPKAIEYITERALKKDRKQRYKSADEMGQDLDLYLQGKEVINDHFFYKNFKAILAVVIVIIIAVSIFLLGK